MYTPFVLAALAVLTSALPSPQLIDLVAIGNYPDSVRVTAPIDKEVDVAASVPAAPIKPLTSIGSSSKRDLTVEKRDGDCSPYPTGSGPVPSPDTVDAFASFPTFAAMATAAPTPDGYEVVFINSNASLTASNYMGLYTLGSYDTLGCASQCDQTSGCQAFNMYIERDPSLNASADNCPNPPSTTNYKCTLWGAPVSVDEATNFGQYQDSFQVVIAGSNGR